MAIARGVHTTASGNGVTTLTTTGVTTTAGSTLVAVTTMGGASGGANTYSSLSDSKGGTWTEIGTAAIFTGSAGIRMFYCKGNSGSRGASHTITFNYNATEFPVIFFFEITGADSSNPLDQNAQANTDNATPYVVGPTGTTTQSDEMVITAIATDSSSSYTCTGYTIDDSNTNSATFWAGAIADKIVSATGTQSASWTTGPGTSKTAIKIATFKQAAAGVSVNATGQSVATHTGTAAAALSLAATGVAKAVHAGAVSLKIALAATGASAAALANGTVGALGAYTLLGVYDGDGVSPAVTSPITTQVSGSSFAAFYSGYTSNNQTPTDNKGNTYTLLDTAVYLGYSGQFNLKLYGVNNGAGGNGHTVSVVKNGQATGEIVVFLGEATHAATLTDWQYAYGASGTSMNSPSITVNGPATLIAIWSGDSPSTSNTIAVDGAWDLIEDFTAWPVGKTSVQTGVASREVTAGTYHATWTCSPSQGAILYILAFEHDGAQSVGIAVNPSGQAAATHTGTVSVPGSASATGQAVGVLTGAVGLGLSVTASGAQAAAVTGSAAPAKAVAAMGQSVGVATGSVGLRLTVTADGEAVPVLTGTPILGPFVTALGSAVGVHAGTIGTLGVAVTAHGAAVGVHTGHISFGGSTPHLVSLTISSVGPRLNSLTITDLD